MTKLNNEEIEYLRDLLYSKAEELETYLETYVDKEVKKDLKYLKGFIDKFNLIQL